MVEMNGNGQKVGCNGRLNRLHFQYNPPDGKSNPGDFATLDYFQVATAYALVKLILFSY